MSVIAHRGKTASHQYVGRTTIEVESEPAVPLAPFAELIQAALTQVARDIPQVRQVTLLADESGRRFTVEMILESVNAIDTTEELDDVADGLLVKAFELVANSDDLNVLESALIPA